MTRIVVHKYVNDGSRFQMKSIDGTNIIETELKPSCRPIKDKGIFESIESSDMVYMMYEFEQI